MSWLTLMRLQEAASILCTAVSHTPIHLEIFLIGQTTGLFDTIPIRNEEMNKLTV